MSNPGDRWRKSAMVGAVSVALIAALTLGRCASNDAASDSTTAQGSETPRSGVEAADQANTNNGEPIETQAPSPDAGEEVTNEAELAPDTVVAPEDAIEAPVEIAEEAIGEIASETSVAEVAAVASETSPVDAEPGADSTIATPVVTDTVIEPTTTLPAPATTTTTPTLEAAGTIALEGVQFDLGSTRLTSQSAIVLDRLVTTLTDNPSLKIAISGHTDNSGDPAFNKTLSAARAKRVLRYLTNKGIAADRLTAVGMGDIQPRADNGTQAGRRQNRRIEVTAQ